jgi:hypothetical protein
MAACLTGMTIRRELFLEQLGVPITGAVLTYSLAGPLGTALLTAQAVTPGPEPGVYGLWLDGSTYLREPGLYRETWEGEAAGSDLYRTGVFRVLPAHGPYLTRWEVRRLIARDLGEYHSGVAQSGGAASLTDLDQINEAFRGQWLYLRGGTGAGQERKIVSVTNGVFAVSRSWGTIPDYTTHYEITPRGVEVYNQALNAVIEEVAAEAPLRVTDGSVQLEDDVSEYRLPDGLHAVEAVSWVDEDDPAGWWHPLSAPYGEWSLLPGGILQVPYAATGIRLRLQATVLPDLVLEDDSYVEVPVGYLRHRTVADLLLADLQNAGTDAKAGGARAARAEQLAERLRPRHRPVPGRLVT